MGGGGGCGVVIGIRGAGFADCCTAFVICHRTQLRCSLLALASSPSSPTQSLQVQFGRALHVCSAMRSGEECLDTSSATLRRFPVAVFTAQLGSPHGQPA